LVKRPSARDRRWALEEQLFGGRRDERAAQRPSECRAIVVPSGDPWSDESYALSHCHDFVVVDARGRRGYVSDVRFQSRVDRPDELEVTFGRLRPCGVWVPVGEVEWMSFERGEIVLSCVLPVSRRLEATKEWFAPARGRVS
jgi:hypothetical protein